MTEDAIVYLGDDTRCKLIAYYSYGWGRWALVELPDGKKAWRHYSDLFILS